MTVKTHDLGPLFYHSLPEIKPRRYRLPDGHYAYHPWVRVDPTWEMDPPYRKSMSLVIRLPRNRALVLGCWLWFTTVESRDAQEEKMGLRLKGEIDFEVEGDQATEGLFEVLDPFKHGVSG